MTLVHLGAGPGATGGAGGGWSRAPDLYFRCARCGYYMGADAEMYDDCYCKAMHRDVDACRFGSSLGDDAIEVYRAVNPG